ncbi:MAG: hypothetical protein K9I85_14975 [Saprospiraceae bacterium]|nr:hypothetical protein [Saprospiraceae bacterium]
MSTPVTFNDYSALSAVLPMIAGGMTWKRQSVAHRFLVVLSAISLAADIAGTISIWWYGNNVSQVNGYLILQSLVTGLFFINLKEFNASLRPILKATFWIMCLVSLTLFLTGPINDSINKWLLTISSFFIICFSFLYFYNLVRFELIVPLWLKSSFYAVTGLMMYHVSNTTIFLTIDYFQPEVVAEMWQLKLVSYVFLNILFAVSMIMEYKHLASE